MPHHTGGMGGGYFLIEINPEKVPRHSALAALDWQRWEEVLNRFAEGIHWPWSRSATHASAPLMVPVSTSLLMVEMFPQVH